LLRGCGHIRTSNPNVHSYGLNKIHSRSNLNGNQMRAYSVDLRQKVIDALISNRGDSDNWLKGSGVSLTFIESLLKRHRTDGTVEPRPRGEADQP